MPASGVLETSLALPRKSNGHQKVARVKIRKLALVWVACAALSWALTVVIGYSVMRFGESGAANEVVAEAQGDEAVLAREAEALSAIAPAAGTAETETQAEEPY